MPAPIYIDFIARGMPDISRAFKSVEDIVVRAEQNGTRATMRETQARARAVEAEAKRKERAYNQLAKQTERWQRQEESAATRAEREKTRAVEREETRRRAIRERSATIAGRLAIQQANNEARERRRAASEAERDRRRSESEAERNARRIASIRDRSATMAGREAIRTSNAEAAQAKADRTDRIRVISSIGGAAARGVAAGAQRVGSMALQTAGLVTQLGGGFDLGGSVQRNIKNRGIAADIANSGFMPNGDIAANRVKRSSGDIMAAAQATSARTGISNEDALGGLGAFVGKSGDLDTGLKSMQGLAQLSVATGASFKDVADAAGDLMSQLGDMPNKSEAVMSIMRGIAGQGKLGAVEMKNLATQMAKLAVSAGQFGGNAVDNILKMGMLAQEARASGGAASATMAATSVTGFVNTLKTPARIKEFKAKGINVFDKDKMLRDPTEIIQESLAATGGDPEQMKTLFANIMGARATEGYANAYRKAEASSPGSGKASVQAMFDRQLKGSSMSKEDVAKAFSERMQEADSQMAVTQAKFDEAVGTKIIPKLLELMPVLEKMIPMLVDAAATGLPAFIDLMKTVAEFASAHKGELQFIAAHPIASVLAAEVVKSMASAQLGNLVSGLLKAAFGAGGGGGGGVGGAAAGALGGYGPAIGLGLAGGAAVSGVIEKSMLGYAAGDEQGANLAAKVRAGMVSPEQAKAMRAQAQSRLDQHGGTLEQVANLVSSPFVEAGDRDYKQYKGDQGFTKNEDLVKAIEEMTLALKNSARPGAGGGAGGSGTPGGAARDQPIHQRT